MIREYLNTDLTAVTRIWVDAHIKQNGFISTDLWRTGMNSINKSLNETDVFVCIEHKSLCGFIQLDGNEIVGLFCAYDRHFKKSLAQLLNHAQSMYDRLVLQPFMTGPEAVKIYHSLGFVTASEYIDDKLYWCTD